VKYYANGGGTNWELPYTTYIIALVLSFPACTSTKNGRIYSSIFFLFNDFSMEEGIMSTEAHLSDLPKKFFEGFVATQKAGFRDFDPLLLC
jgi:hypothetical protein